MTWAMKRRLVVLAVIAGIILVFVTAIGYFTVYKAPSCVDGKQNQTEEGIDCGGTCTYLCTASQSAPSVRFARALSPQPARTDVIAYIDNPNTTSAAKAVPYVVELYSDTNTVIARKEGVTDLPPSNTVPIFVPNFFSGSQAVAHTFVTFDTSKIHWFKIASQPVRPSIDGVVLTQDGTPRVTARVSNSTAYVMRNVRLVATVFGADGNAIGASATLLNQVPAQGSANVIFTWPQAFGVSVSRIEVLPILSLDP